jgi:hypothetical protein
MAIDVEENQRDEPVASEAQGRWDVGLGERLVETIWNWLGRDARDRERHTSSVNGVTLRKAA